MSEPTDVFGDSGAVQCHNCTVKFYVNYITRGSACVNYCPQCGTEVAADE